MAESSTVWLLLFSMAYDVQVVKWIADFSSVEIAQMKVHTGGL
jgi:hypothetical protein